MELARQALSAKRQRVREERRLALVTKSQTTFSQDVAADIVSKPLLATPLFVDPLRHVVGVVRSLKEAEDDDMVWPTSDVSSLQCTLDAYKTSRKEASEDEYSRKNLAALAIMHEIQCSSGS